jgi:hypothetical protein
MARSWHIETSPRLLPVDLQAQLVLGSFAQKRPFAAGSNGSITDHMAPSGEHFLQMKNNAVARGLCCCLGSSEECGPRWPAALPGAPVRR